MQKLLEGILIGLTVAILLLTVAVAGIFIFWMPYNDAVSGFAENTGVTMYLLEDGSVELNWPYGEKADIYVVELIDPITGKAEHTSYVEGNNSCIIPGFPQKLCTLRITTVREYSFLFDDTVRSRVGENAIEITDTFLSPQITEINTFPNPDESQVQVKLEIAEGSTIRLYKQDDAGKPVAVNSFDTNMLTLYFGEGKLWPVPAFDERYTFVFDAYRKGEGYIFYGPQSQAITVNRQDLLGTNLVLNAEDNGDNSFTLTWNETKGEHYEFQFRPDAQSQWQTIMSVHAQGERSYITPTMGAFTSTDYRVLAKDEAGELITVSEVLPVKMGAAVTYSTIWPIKDLEVYSDTDKTKKIGTAVKGKAFCVLLVRDGMFLVRLGDDFGYIDANYCLVNLPECMGDLCTYNIANSYASVFKIHEYPIPGITDTVIMGYENVMVGENQYLVPLLYPAIEKLGAAAQAAKALGYTLKIYDAYRPQIATQQLYDVTVSYAESTLVPPEPPQPPVTPDGTEGTTEPTQPVVPQTTTPVEPWPEMTFAQFMTNNGKYKMNFFLAKGTSRHNRGAALDLTIENLEGEVLMQTSIHDLSWYSEVPQNNEAAKLLETIMKGAGFGGLVSEWWHFQDDDVLTNLNPPALDVGVTPECWMADEGGWRYRGIDGIYLVDCAANIDGVEYEFDAYGYATPV